MSMKPSLPLLAVIALLMPGWPARGAGPASQPSPIQYREEVRPNPPLHLHIVSADLSDPRVAVKVVRGGDDPDGPGPWQTKLATVREMANRAKLEVAVNGNFFACKEAVEVLGRKNPYFTGNWATVTGWAMSDGVLWGTQRSAASLVVDARGQVSIGRFGMLPKDAKQIVSSGEQLVNFGRNVGRTPDLAPRTAIGVDRAGKQLVLLVVDGRREDYSVGMTAAQLADELIKLGCWDALMMDGGGSSTMVLRDAKEGKMRVMNSPSDGHDLPLGLSIERPVACALGIAIKEDPTTKP